MFLRVTDQLRENNAIFNISSVSNELALLQQELSTGLAVGTPSANPGAYSLIFGYQTQLNAQTALTQNISDAQQFINNSQSALSSMVSLLDRVQTLYATGNNEALTATDRQNVVTELNSLLNTAVAIGNTQVNGEYIFAGSKVNTQPFTVTGNPPISVTYTGDNQYLQDQIGPNESINKNIPGSVAFMGGNGANPLNNIFTAITNLRDTFGQSERLSLMSINNPPAVVNPAGTIFAQSANFATTPIQNGNLTFQVNGVNININTSNAVSSYGAPDTLNSIIGKINASNAGVTASFDPVTERIFLVSNANPGRLVTVNDAKDLVSGVTSNFASGFGQLLDPLQQLDSVQTMLVNDESLLGVNSNRIQQVTTTNQSLQTTLTAAVTTLQDTPVPQTISQDSLQQTALQYANQVAAQILSPNSQLFTYLA